MEHNSLTPIDIEAVGYNEEHKTVEIRFKNGAVYEYYDFPSDVVENFVNANSLNEFFEAKIRRVYAFSRVD